MAANIQVLNADDDVITTVDFGVVLNGTTSDVTALKIKNTGDATAYNVRVKVIQGTPDDGGATAAFGSTPIESDYVQVASTLAANASVTVNAQWSFPGDAPLVSTKQGVLRVAYKLVAP